jgi:gluconolactonase
MNRAAPAGIVAAAFAALLLAQDFTGINLLLLCQGYNYTDGPAWSKDGYLIFSDTPSDRLMKWVPGREPEVWRADAHGPGGNAFDSQGRLYTCETRTRRVTRTGKNGAIEVVADRWEGKRLNAPNDIAISRADHVYFTDPAFGEQADHRELDFYGVYYLPPKGPMKLAAKTKGRPNGIALSPNGRILYVADSDEHAVRAYELDHNGDVGGGHVVISNIPAVPDGIRVDEKGNLFVAAKGISVYSPDGKLLASIPVKELPSNCAFGETDQKSLFITARGKVYRARMPMKGAY